jgi:hypothetical protein
MFAVKKYPLYFVRCVSAIWFFSEEESCTASFVYFSNYIKNE